MDTIQIALKLIQPGCFMALVDLKAAYYSISVAEEHRKFLKFYWEDCYFQFTCLPNGLACAPRFFTKVLKLRLWIDSLILLVMTIYTACKRNIHDIYCTGT